jgi:hypothetical protein
MKLGELALEAVAWRMFMAWAASIYEVLLHVQLRVCLTRVLQRCGCGDEVLLQAELMCNTAPVLYCHAVLTL